MNTTEDLTVTVINSVHVPAVGTDLQLHSIHRVTIMVGRFGPYTHDFAGKDDNPETINAWKQTQANAVRAIL